MSLLCAPRAAVLAAAALVAGGLAGHARVTAIDQAGEGLQPGDRVEGRAHLMSPPRPGPFGSSAEARMTSGPALGAKLLVRFPPDARLPTGTDIGSEVELSGSVRPAKPPAEGEFDLAAYLRRRGVAGELDAERVEVTGRRRGGVAGTIDRMRGRAQSGIASGLTGGSQALARGMILGQDEAIDPLVRDDFRVSGLAHVLTYQHQDRRRVCEPFGFRMESFHSGRGPNRTPIPELPTLSSARPIVVLARDAELCRPYLARDPACDGGRAARIPANGIARACSNAVQRSRAHCGRVIASRRKEKRAAACADFSFRPRRSRRT